MIQKPMHCAEIAQRMGVALDTFYKNRHRYSQLDGMPHPISQVGRPAYERAGMEIWLTRHDPRRPPPAANDSIPPLDPATIEEEQALFHAEYGAYASGVVRPALDKRRRQAGR